MYYAATVTSVLGFLHRRNIVYRDLKPENLVLDAQGYLRVVDFGFAKVVSDKTYTLCGTPEYIAPEMVTGKGHGRGVDYWALGVLTYEMLAGYSPFADHAGRDHRTIYKKILRGTYRWSSKISDPALRDLIARFLTSNPTKRLGCLRGGEDDIRSHAWFAQSRFDWAALDSKSLAPPVVPEVKGPADVSHFEDFKETEKATIVEYKDDGSGWDSGF
jgi:serine/threonine protein kinase